MHVATRETSFPYFQRYRATMPNTETNLPALMLQLSRSANDITDLLIEVSLRASPDQAIVQTISNNATTISNTEFVIMAAVMRYPSIRPSSSGAYVSSLPKLPFYICTHDRNHWVRSDTIM